MKLPDEMTIGDAYGPAMEIIDLDEAQKYLEALIDRNVRITGNTRAEAHRIELSNLGYYSGYYDHETMVRVNELFGAIHPIVGTSTKLVSPKKAFKMGKKLVKRSR